MTRRLLSAFLALVLAIGLGLPAAAQGPIIVFAAASTGYIFIGMMLEERDLVAAFGETYLSYRARVRMIVPLPRRRG